MGTLANFPTITQLDSNINAQFDCVPACIAASLAWLTGQTYTAGQVKNSVYGPGYTGSTAAAQYVSYCQSQGVELIPYSGSGYSLVSQVLHEISLQHPVIMTEPDPYDSDPGLSHVVVAFQSDSSTITAMDPFIAGRVTKTFTEWANQLQYNQVWGLQGLPKEVIKMKNLTASNDDKQVWNLMQKVAGDVPLIDLHGIPQSWLRGRWTRGLNFGPPLENERSVTRDSGLVTEQQFTAARAVWDPKRGTCTWYTASGPIIV